MMKKIVYLTLVLITFFNCDKNKEQNKTQETPTSSTSKPKTEKQITKQNSEQPVTPKTSISKTQLETTILNFKNCKTSATKRSDCRNALTTFISKSYNLQDFKGKNGDYMIYDSIQPIIKKSNTWEKLGAATNQNIINKASKHVKNGGLALVIDTSQTYGHIVIVQDNELKNSGSWGLKLPIVFSLSNHNPSKSFHDKTLAYAFKKSDDLQVFIRK